jgi:SAM-dependent methyltransferase
MHRSRVDVQRARAVLHTRGLSHCVLQQGEIKSLPHAAAGFDTVIVDRSLLAAPRPADALREFARLLVTKGELVVVEDYDRLEGWDDVADNALVLLRSWLADAGLACRRLHPIDIAGQHVVIAVARREIPASAAA